MDRLLVKDAQRYWHVMIPVAHRLRARCGYLDLDATAVKRGDYPNCTTPDLEHVTCDNCYLLTKEAEKK